MNSRVILIIVGLFVPIFVSCSAKPKQTGGNPPQEQSLSLQIKTGGNLEFSQEEVAVFTLIPKGKPSGEIALKTVQNGQVTKLRSIRFDQMSGEGSLAVRTTNTNAEIAFRADCVVWSPSSSGSCPLPAKEKMRLAGSNDWGGKQGGPECIIWNRAYCTAGELSKVSSNSYVFDKCVTESKKQPTVRQYVVTIRLDSAKR